MPIDIYLRRLDFRLIFLINLLMLISLLVISSAAQPIGYGEEFQFFTPMVQRQLFFFVLGWGCFFFLSYMDYRTLRKQSPLIYFGILLLLVGLFFTDPIQNVRRWYKLPLINFALQPSEYAKLALVIALSFFLEKNKDHIHQNRTIIQTGILVMIPFALILKQPDLGTSLVLLPITYVMLYFGGAPRKVLFMMGLGGVTMLAFVVSMFVGFISHDEFKPIALKFIKEYQYERLNPDTYHQKSAQIAIALGSLTGSGWGESEYTAKRWLPFADTDSVFPAFTEQFGLLGAFVLLASFFFLVYISFQVTAVAKDVFGRLLSAGIAVYLGIHVIVNVGMMCGLLPITGVPLLLISYGGSSVMSAMIALGILQSIYVRRYMY